MTAPHGGRTDPADDILMLEADVDGLSEALSVFGIKLEQQGASSDKDKAEKAEKAAKDQPSDKADKAERRRRRPDGPMTRRWWQRSGRTATTRAR